MLDTIVKYVTGLIKLKGGTDGTIIGNSSDSLKVNVSNSSIPVTDNSGSLTVDNGGTFAVQSAQSGTWTVQPGNTANTTAWKVDGSAVTQPVSGTVTATLAATVVEDAASAGGESSILVAGVRNDSAASKTSADGDFGNIAIDSAGRVGISDLGGAISIDDNGGSITVDGTVAATQSGTWNVGTVTTVTNVVHVDDNSGSITVDAPVGTPAFVRLSDGSAAITTLPVSLASVPSHAVTNAGTFVVQENGAALTALQKIDDPVIVDDTAFTPATSSVMMMGAEFDDTSPDSVDEGDAGAVRMSGNRNIYVQLRDAAGNERGLNIDSSNRIAATVVNSVATNLKAEVVGTGTLAVQATLAAGATNIAKAEDVASADADVGVPSMAVRKATPANTSGTDGDYEFLQMSAGRLWASATIDAALPAGANAIGKLSANDGVDVGDVTINNASGGSAVNIQDGGNSITVDGTVAFSNTTIATTNAGTFAVQATLAAGAASIGKAEDVASADADVGVPSMAVRKATPANTSGTDGDYEFLQMSAGRLWTSSVIDTALPAGTNVIGHVIMDTTSTTAVTQATASNLNATVVGTGTFAVQAAEADGANVTLGSKADAKSTATDTTAVTAMSVLKQISASVQAPPSQAVTNAGTFAVQATIASGATAIAKAEDVASADADVGVPAMAIRKATPANTSGTDGDYEMLQMSAGRLWVDPSGVTLTVASHAVTVASGGVASGAIASGALASGSVASGAIASGAVASGAFASGSIAAGAVAAGATSFVKLEDVASADADAGVPAMAIRKATPANSSGTDGDYEMLQMSAGRLWVDPSGVTLTTAEVRPATSTVTSVASSASSVSLLASNTSAKLRTFYNDSTQVLYIKFGATASTTSYTVQVAAGGYYEVPQPLYTGAIDGIWASANGNARITEVT